MIVVRLARATAALAHELGGEGGLSASPTGGYTYIFIYSMRSGADRRRPGGPAARRPCRGLWWYQGS